jgi:hypothetical protein
MSRFESRDLSGDPEGITDLCGDPEGIIDLLLLVFVAKRR